MEHEVVGQCPICDRDMWKGNTIDKHHFIPKCRGGKDSQYLHKICHRKIHSIWTATRYEGKFTDLIKKEATIEVFNHE
jgi:hypothetical protein